jgi:hypothetical protein
MRYGIEERRARLGIRHHLASAARAGTVAGAVESLVALHSTDPASVFLSLHARVAGVTPKDIEDSLYVRRCLLRMLGMRRTMFVVPSDLAPVIQAACTNAIAEQQRKQYTQLLAAAGLGDGTLLDNLCEEALGALKVRGEATGTQLSTDVPRLRTPIVIPGQKVYGPPPNLTTWVLFLLAADGRIVRGRPRGTWISSQYHWSPVEAWLPQGIEEIPPSTARAQLVRRWLSAFGPGPVADLRWWTGWTAAHVKAALVAVGAVEVDLGGEVGAILPGDDAPTPTPEPWVALLPALDPTAMGWSRREWYVGPHTTALFDRSGNIGPTIWADGRIIGGWIQRKDGDVAYRLLEDVGRHTARAVAQRAGDLAEWIGPVRVTPRFRTPLERELAA